MPDTQQSGPLRGADAINDGELEVGFDERFETRWSRAEVVGRVVMALIVAAGLAGLMGRGPFSHRTTGTPGGGLTVDREPVVHYGTGTQVTFHIDPSKVPPEADGGGREWVIHLSNIFIEPMGLQTILPEPLRQTSDGKGIALTFRLDPAQHDDLVRVMLKPTQVGPQDLVAKVGDETLEWTQVVLP